MNSIVSFRDPLIGPGDLVVTLWLLKKKLVSIIIFEFEEQKRVHGVEFVSLVFKDRKDNGSLRETTCYGERIANKP